MDLPSASTASRKQHEKREADLKLLVAVSQALQNLDPEVRRDYDRAMEIVPPRVREETKYMDFLRVEDMDPVRAAKRIALYWQCRREVFGDARWLLPLAQNGAGALSRDDIEFLNTGFLLMLPRPGRPTVILLDQSRLPRQPYPSGLRISFYLVYLFSNVITQSEGAILLHVVTTASFEPTVFDKAWVRFINSIPFKIQKYIVARCAEPGKEALIESYAYQERRIIEFRTELSSIEVAGNSPEETLRLLEEHGLDEESVPKSLGGTYDYSSFYAWIRERQRLEDALHGPGVIARVGDKAPLKLPPPPSLQGGAATPGVSEAVSASATTTAPATAARTTKAAATEAQSNVSGESREEFLRKRNAMYVRRFYQKRNMEIIAMREQSKDLQARNAKLREENRQLEAFLAQARLLAAQHDTIQSEGEDPNISDSS